MKKVKKKINRKR